MIDLYKEIANGRNKFENEIFNPIYQSIATDTAFLKFNELEFINCEFNFFELEDLDQSNLSIFFKECTFNDQIRFSDVYLNQLLFVEIRKMTYLDISGKFTRIRFNNKNTPLNGNIYLNLEIIQELNFEYFNQTDGDFSLTVNKGNLEKKEEFRTFFNNAKFNKLEVSNSNFGYITNFKTITVLNELTFNECVFEEIYFDNSILLGLVNFNECTFNRLASFQHIVSDVLTDFKIIKSKFVKTANFNKSSIIKLTLDDNVFNELAFFQETLFSTILIDRTIFEKTALFDDIRIAKINDCNRRTIRNIKLQLQKAENKIDYNRFRVYEFDAYKLDIKEKIKYLELYNYPWNHRNNEAIQLKRDLFVLNLSEYVSDYGTDWKRALNFTFWCGLSIYILFYLSENYNNTIDISNWNNWTRLISGFFRFFLVTDFYNPLETDRIYLTNPISWLIFIFGKIVIAFGIYEMIQSFRKFKA